MQRFYAVDRSCRLRVADVLGWDTDYTHCRFFPIAEHFSQPALEELVHEVFPAGLSAHGKRYLLDQCLVVDGPGGPAPFVPNVPVVELILELVRRLEYPERLSRMEAIFAWESEAAAIEFKTRYCNGQGNIVVLEGKPAGRYDMQQLFLGGTTIGSWLFARRYWSAVASQEPQWEILLEPAVAVREVLA